MKCVINLFSDDEEVEIVLNNLNDEIIKEFASICFRSSSVESVLEDMIRTYVMKNTFLD